jgi:glycosyltransferase involved in cell wall biosynthesis
MEYEVFPGKRQTSMKISVVIPVFNGSNSLPELVSRLGPVLEGLCDQSEVILINDGSKDSSWETICQLTAKYPTVRGINLMRNYGQHNALLCGIRAALYEAIVTLDDDLQNPPEEIPALIRKLEQGPDVVYGKPLKEQHGLWRDVASRITKLALQKAMGSETAGNVSAFRAFRAHLRDGFAAYNGAFVSIDVLLTWATTRFDSVAVAHSPRGHGESNYTFRKLVAHAFNMITGFTIVPLQIASLMGFCFTVFGIGIFAFVVGRYFLEGGSVPGFPFLASIIALFSGAQMLSIGVIGEYLARMHSRLLDRPVYAIREVTSFQPGKKN